MFLASLLALACVRPPAREGVDEIERWKRTASTLRELAFREPVRVEWIESEKIPEIARSEVEQLFSPDYVEGYRDAYAALGLLPTDLDLLETVLALQADQLVGLYSVTGRKLYVVVNHPGEQGPPMILVHELVHALQHQHFGRTVEIMQGLQHSDDVVTALGAALEGDASLTMLAVGRDDREARAQESAEQFRDAMLMDLDRATGFLAEVPRLLRVSLIAPYAYGVVLAANRFEQEGSRGLDRLVSNPPLASVQVLFPDEADPVDFIRLPLEWLESQVKPLGCTIGHDNVGGALTVKVFFEEFAPGLEIESWLRSWRGDRFIHLPCADGPRVVWLLRWDNHEVAQRFATAYRKTAPAAAARAGLPKRAEVVVGGHTTLVLSPSLLSLAAELVDRAEIRRYAAFTEWVEQGCFPESSCPAPVEAATTSLFSPATPP
jgi:hypothetical protein